MSFNALLIFVKENLKLVLSILFDETFNPLRTKDDCSPNKSFTISDGALKIFGNTGLFQTNANSLVNL